MSQWKDRKQNIEQALFEGHCFARFRWADRFPVVTDPGVVEIYGSGTNPDTIPDEEIRALRSLVMSNRSFVPCAYEQEGKPARVIRGRLKGMQGILLAEGQSIRLVIPFPRIHQAFAAEINAGDIEPL